MSRKELSKREPNGGIAAEEIRYRNVPPVCDVYENANEYLIMAEMPGVEEDSIDLRLDRTRLSIHANRAIRSDGRALASELAPTRYVRVFDVPETIDNAEISAHLDNGLLSVRLPKAPHARVRQIPVTSG